MIIYFSKADPIDLQMFGSEGTFQAGDAFYYNGVEFGTNPGGMDEVRIFDSCGRSVPLCVEQIGELIEALQHCRRMCDRIEQAREDEATAESHREFVVFGENDNSWFDVRAADEE